MNKRKPVDYTELYTQLDAALEGAATQMEQYAAIGEAVALRPEKGAAVAAADYLQEIHPELSGFSPRNLRRMRAFYQTYGNHPDLLELAMQTGWTLNVLILETDLSLPERAWYLSAVLRFGWTKAVLQEKLAEFAHLNEAALYDSQPLWYTKGSEAAGRERREAGVKEKEKCYICCDLKSFYASVECIERGLDPLTTNLVVADKRRTEKTLCRHYPRMSIATRAAQFSPFAALSGYGAAIAETARLHPGADGAERGRGSSSGWKAADPPGKCTSAPGDRCHLVFAGQKESRGQLCHCCRQAEEVFGG